MGLSLCTLLPFRETGVGVSGWHLHLGREREYVDPLERCQLWRVAPTEFRLELVKPLFDTDENRHNPLSLRPPVAPGTADNAKGITTNYSVLNIHWQDWCWSWNSNTLATWCEELTPWKRPWCWESLKAGGEGDDRGWDGWMASPTQWTWVWASSGCWWWTGRPGVLQSMASQRVRHDWVTELNWTSLNSLPCLSSSIVGRALGDSSGFGTAKD